jgi:ankyrin repeat protein
MMAWRGKPELVRLLIKAGADAGAKNSHGLGVFHLVAMNGGCGAVEALAAMGAGVDDLVQSGCNALQCMANQGRASAIELLARCRVKHKAEDSEGRARVTWRRPSGGEGQSLRPQRRAPPEGH